MRARTIFGFVGKGLDEVIKRSGKVICLLILVIMATATWEVVTRYLLNRPTQWVWPINRQLFGIFILFAGVYTMSQRGHIRVEIFYDFFPAKLKQVARIVAFTCFVLFMGVLVWQSAWMGWNSFVSREVASGAFGIPMYPFKLMVPIMAFIFLIEGVFIMLRPNSKGK